MSIKQQYGQFMTTRYEYILQNMVIPDNITNIIEPFAGNGDLLKFLKKDFTIECYDIAPNNRPNIIQRDTLNDIPDYNNKWVLTNPPYLARNKCKDKALFDKFGVNDLYKCFLKILITNKALGGIIIVPLNFFSSIRVMDIYLREEFMKVYHIKTLNIFEETVFDDTTFTVCSFRFDKVSFNKDLTKLKCLLETDIYIYPSKKNFKYTFSDSNKYTIGYLNIPNQKIYKITRLINEEPNTNILVKCIDDNANNKISLKIVPTSEIYFDRTPNKSERTYCSLLISPPISIEKQQELVNKFNIYFNNYRNKYNSLFLSNYRESKKNFARKRVSFDLIYNLVGYFLTTSDEMLDKVFR